MEKIFHLAKSFRGPSLYLASSIAIACDEAEPSGGRRVRKSDIVHLQQQGSRDGLEEAGALHTHN